MLLMYNCRPREQQGYKNKSKLMREERNALFRNLEVSCGIQGGIESLGNTEVFRIVQIVSTAHRFDVDC